VGHDVVRNFLDGVETDDTTHRIDRSEAERD
jgi:hypothetical protein